MDAMEKTKLERFRELLAKLPKDKREVVLAFMAGVEAVAEKMAG